MNLLAGTSCLQPFPSANKAGRSCTSVSDAPSPSSERSLEGKVVSVLESNLDLHRYEQCAFAGHPRNHAAYEKGWGWIREAGVYREGSVVVQAGAARFGSVQKYRDL